MEDEIIKSVHEGKNGKVIAKVDMDQLIASQPNAGENKDHYIITCPFCLQEHIDRGQPGYNKQKLYIKKDKTVGYCMRCHTIYVRYFDAVTDNIKLINVPDFHTVEYDHIEKIPTHYSQGLDFYNNAKELSPALIEYLKGRRSSAVINNLDIIKFRCYNDREILIPFYYMGELIYYQINYTNPVRLKYKNPPVKRKPLYILREGKPTVVISEGIYDAIANLDLFPDTTSIALLGCDITDYHIWMLRRLCPSKIYIFLDDTKLSTELATKLNNSLLASYCEIIVVQSDGTDPDEYLKMKDKENEVKN